MRPSLLIIVSLLGLSGCVIRTGTRAENLEEARTPAGSGVTIELASGETLDGELLAASDSALVLHQRTRIALVPYTVISVARVAVFKRPMSGRRRPDAGLLADLKLASRYPQGISDQLMARLLAQGALPALVVLPP